MAEDDLTYGEAMDQAHGELQVAMSELRTTVAEEFAKTRLLRVMRWFMYLFWPALKEDDGLSDVLVDERIPRLPLSTQTIQSKFRIAGKGEPTLRNDKEDDGFLVIDMDESSPLANIFK